MLASDHHLVHKDLGFLMKHSKRVFFRCRHMDWVYVMKRSKLVSCRLLQRGWEFDWKGYYELMYGHYRHSWSDGHCRSFGHPYPSILVAQECHQA